MRNFELYCKDYQDIENYDAAKKDNFYNWEVHHKLETNLPNGERRDVDIPRKELIKLGMYYDRPADELVFLMKSEHKSLHKNRLGKPFSEEAKKKISEAGKGNTNTKGMHWYNNGKINKLCYECPDGFVPGRISWKK